MYVPMRDEPQPIQLKIPWDPHTAKGFVVATVILIVWMFAMSVSDIRIGIPDYARASVPMDTMISIRFGDGDGTGISKGNLTAEGRRNSGENPQSDLHDAERAGATRHDRNANPNTDVENASDFNPVDELSSDGKNIANRGGSDRNNVGSRDGSPDGRGLGEKGFGKGKGKGFGDIEWGGGGNRTVMRKVLPKYPKGLNRGAQIRIKFTVSSDGRVIDMIPLTKGDPQLEQAAQSALRKWRFNPLKDDIVMKGVITFTFRLS